MIANIVKEINEFLNNGQPYSALGMALALPDICGSISYPDLGVGERYRQWFDKYVVEPENPIFKDGFISMDNAQNTLVIRTVSGMAMAVAAALDHMELPEIVGSIAGDDTIMCAIRSVDDTIAVMERLRKVVDETSVL